MPFRSILRAMLIFGFKPARFRQWKDVLREEARHASYSALLLAMLKTLLRGKRVDRSEWRRRLRICRTCPIYGRALRTCRPFPGAQVGCGCVVWTLALFKAGGCWADENVPKEKIGWLDRKSVV